MTDEMASAMSSLDRETEMAGAFALSADLRTDNRTPLADAIDADAAFLLLALLMSPEPAPTPDDLDCSVIRYKLEGVSCAVSLPEDGPLLAALSKVRPDTSDESDGAISKLRVVGTLNSRAGKSFLSAIVGLFATATAAAPAFPAGCGDGVSAACATF